MSRLRSDAMFERIGGHAKQMGALLKRLYQAWRRPDDRTGAPDRRRPGPQFRDEIADAAYDSDPPRRPG